eukprot:TRINITY_DN26437_c0_g2_i1.p1 TRINITY_DN26437_c0_g2~~TRINITY_DN26437_c0_g2_i1.p1  ORF type:complete len:263 (-),score=68.37 TRINITY_DN26437_c0_g2_i1:230-1018(-)
MAPRTGATTAASAAAGTRKSSAAVKQTTVVHVIRHGEAQHNVDHKYLAKRDTTLTARGRRQAGALQEVLSDLKPQLLVTSPILRALQTAQALAFKGGKTLVVPDARERVACESHQSDLPIDPANAAAKSFEALGWDWSLLHRDMAAVGAGAGADAGDCDGDAGADDGDAAAAYLRSLMDYDLAGKRHIEDRARRLSTYLEERPESDVVLVSHGAFLMHLTGDSYMGNCEVRSYEVSDGGWHAIGSPRTGARDVDTNAARGGC